MPDYTKAKIYTIRCKTDNNLIYVGSTYQPLYKRLSQHKCSSKNSKYENNLLFKSVNDDWNNWYIELYENYPCNNKEELLKREGEVIREIGTLNKIISGRTPKEYRVDNKEQYDKWCENNEEHLKEYRKKYKEEHKDKINNFLKDYRNNHKEKIAEQKKQWYENNKEIIAEREKERYKNNKDEILKQKKQWYENNKDEILKQQKEKRNRQIQLIQ